MIACHGHKKPSYATVHSDADSDPSLEGGI
jgi:hypothetical protein